jgi:phosphate transport system protein
MRSPEPHLWSTPSILLSAEEAAKMLKDSLKALISEDAQFAHNVCERDDIMDGLRDQVCRELIAFMASDPAVIERSMRLIRISWSLERIADLSTNICEDVIYMAEGKMIKHGKIENRPRERERTSS